MASNKKQTRADQAVSEAKKKTSGGKSTAKNNTKKKNDEKKSVVKTEYDRTKIPANWTVAIVSMALFILFVGISVSSEGWLLEAVEMIVLGLIGKVGFYFSIPVLLYLFVINAFRSRTNIQMRSICLVCFVLICGCISHLLMPTGEIGKGFKFISEIVGILSFC